MIDQVLFAFFVVTIGEMYKLSYFTYILAFANEFTVVLHLPQGANRVLLYSLIGTLLVKFEKRYKHFTIA